MYWQDLDDRKKAEESLRRHAERLDLISSTASNLLATDDPQTIIEDLCGKVMAHLDCHVFFNYLVDEKTKRLSLNAYAGIASKMAREIAFLEFGAALCGCAARDGCRIVAEHIPTTPDPRADLVRSFGVKAYAAHPLFARGKVIGTLSFGTKSRHTFSEDELSLMKTVTDQVATAMERKHLLEVTRERAEELEARVRERTVELSRQAALLDLAYDAVIVRTMEGKVRFWSSGAEATYGFTREETLGELIDALIHTVFPLPFGAIMDIIAREGRWEGELVHTRKDGEKIVVLSRWALRKASADQPPEILEINRDISERKRAEELVSRVSNYNRSLLETSLDPLVTISPEGKITDVNEATIKVTGTSREGLIGTDFSDYFTEPDKAREGYEQVFAKGYVTNYPLTIRDRGGRFTHVLYNASLYRDTSGEARGVFAAARDVTALRQAAGYARSLLEASLDPLVTISPEGKISDVNSATEQVTGYVRTELVGTDFSDYFTVPQKARAGYRAVFDEGYVRDYPLEIRHRDGHVTPVLYNASVYRDDTGSVIGVFAAARDMTGQRQLEAQLRQSQKMDALGMLAGGIAHDFNNILAAIIGFSELAQDGLSDDAREKRYMERVLQAGVRGRELVRQMLTFSRQTEQEAKPLQLSSVVKETMKLLRASIPTTISIRVDVKSASGFVLADPVQMQQIIMNLCTNAAHAMGEKGGVLDVQLSDFNVTESGAKGVTPGPYMRLVVRDSGVGIVPEHMEKIFDPFFTTKKLGEGTGLGLSVVHGIVHQHGGSIMAESEPGTGSAFTVYLPRIADVPRPAKARETDLASGHERILLVDDEEALVEIEEELLTNLGYAVTSRRNSREALALFRLDPARFDLVLSDQTMPEMTGLELAREVKALRSDIPVVLNTGFSHLVDAERAKEAGIDAFAMKPLTKKEIARTVRKVLDGVKKR